jgi:hypothetical protein
MLLSGTISFLFLFFFNQSSNYSSIGQKTLGNRHACGLGGRSCIPGKDGGFILTTTPRFCVSTHDTIYLAAEQLND